MKNLKFFFLVLFLISLFWVCRKGSYERCHGEQIGGTTSHFATIDSCILSVDGKEYAITFDVATQKAKITLPINSTIPKEATLKRLAISAGASSSAVEGAKITILNNKAIITLTAQDGTTKISFTIEFVVASSYVLLFNIQSGSC